MPKVPGQLTTEELVIFVEEEEEADTLKPPPFSLTEQLEHLGRITANHEALQARVTMAKSWETVCEQIIAACKKKLHCEKDKREYHKLTTEGGNHVDILRAARMRSDESIESINRATAKITELQSLLQKARTTDWNNLQLIETRTVATEIKYDQTTLDNMHTQLNTALKNIRKHLGELKSYNINFNQT